MHQDYFIRHYISYRAKVVKKQMLMPTEQEIIMVLTKETMVNLATLVNDKLAYELTRLVLRDRKAFHLMMRENSTLMVESMYILVGQELIYFLAFLCEDELVCLVRAILSGRFRRTQLKDIKVHICRRVEETYDDEILFSLFHRDYSTWFTRVFYVVAQSLTQDF